MVNLICKLLWASIWNQLPWNIQQSKSVKNTLDIWYTWSLNSSKTSRDKTLAEFKWIRKTYLVGILYVSKPNRKLNPQIVKVTLMPAGDYVVKEKRWHEKLPNLFKHKKVPVFVISCRTFCLWQISTLKCIWHQPSWNQWWQNWFQWARISCVI